MLHALSPFEPSMPLWFTAHGCTARWMPAPSGLIGDQRRHRLTSLAPIAPCVAGSNVLQRARALCRQQGERCEPGSFVQALDGGPYIWAEDHTSSRTLRQANCGGLGCVFSRGLLDRVAARDVTAPDCRQCSPGMADLQLSYCLFFQSGYAPTGLPGFSWGETSQETLELVVERFPACVKACGHAAAAAAGACLAACATKYGMRDWISLHMRFRGRTWRDTPLASIIRAQHAASLQAQPSLALTRRRALRGLCCRLVHGGLEQCTNGCVPGRPLNWSTGVEPKSRGVGVLQAQARQRRREGHLACGEA